MQNEIKKRPQEEAPEPQVQEEQGPKKPSKIVKAAEYSFFLDRDNLRRLFPMVFLVAGLCMFYIYNAHYAQKIVRKTDDVKDEIKELRAQYITITSDLMSDSKLSEVSKKPELQHLQVLRTPPYKITYTKEDER